MKYQDQIVCMDFREVAKTLVYREDIIVISDPPYNQGYHYDNYSDRLSAEEYMSLLEDAFALHPSVVIHYPEQAINVLPAAIGKECRQVVSWVYPSNTAKQHRLITWWGCEPNMRAVGQPYKNPTDKRVAKLIAAGKEARLYDWWEINQVKNVSKKHSHSCPIPYEIAERIVLTTTTRDQTVFDPFCGSGTILAAAKAHGRGYIGCDISSLYVSEANERLVS
jgi:site-specific DNA-methyltransferase (adenine-specific)